KQFLCSTPEMMIELDQRIREVIAAAEMAKDPAPTPMAGEDMLGLDDVPLGAGEHDDEPITLG
ncbi:MAG: hypothetical protein ACRD0B_13040, partial [Acidimicrobiales bacterium]